MKTNVPLMDKMFNSDLIRQNVEAMEIVKGIEAIETIKRIESRLKGEFEDGFRHGSEYIKERIDKIIKEEVGEI